MGIDVVPCSGETRKKASSEPNQAQRKPAITLHIAVTRSDTDTPKTANV